MRRPGARPETLALIRRQTAEKLALAAATLEAARVAAEVPEAVRPPPRPASAEPRYEHTGDGRVQLAGGNFRRPWVMSVGYARNERFEALETVRSRFESQWPGSLVAQYNDRLIASLLVALDAADHHNRTKNQTGAA